LNVSEREPAASELLLVLHFINTLDLERVADEVASPAHLAGWLEEKGQGAVAVDVEGHARALALREALRGLALANNGGTLYPVDLATLNRAAAETRLRPRFVRGGARLVPEAPGLDAVLGRFVAAVYQAMGDGTWQRVKACPRHDCRFVFLDQSRNGKRTWCSMQTCGNRAKARRHRERSAEHS
jgi:predicted RNA-binding Zn ribbon-like protein